MSPPQATSAPDPQYSEEARAAHHEGSVVLWLIVDADGLPQDIKVQKSLGMGLDERGNQVREAMALSTDDERRQASSSNDQHPR